MNPLTTLLIEIETVLNSLPPGICKYRTFGPSWMHYSIGQGKLRTNFDIHWYAKLSEYQVCAETAWKRFCCRQAHGDQCGSRSYVALRNQADAAHTKIRSLIKESGLLERGKATLYNNFSMSRKGITLYFDIDLKMSDENFPDSIQQAKKDLLRALPEHPLKNRLTEEEAPLFLGPFQKILSEEIGREVRVSL